jgi:hypothetical protein
MKSIEKVFGLNYEEEEAKTSVQRTRVAQTRLTRE